MQVAFQAFSAVYKFVFCCNRFYKSITDQDAPGPVFSIRIPVEKVPWFWIGVKLHDGKLMTVTDDVNACIGDGDTIHIGFISSCIGIEQKLIQGCYYLDSKTLEEKEFPPEGLTIHNDTK